MVPATGMMCELPHIERIFFGIFGIYVATSGAPGYEDGHAAKNLLIRGGALCYRSKSEKPELPR